MRLDSLQLTNYRCYSDLTVEFKPGFNVIVGINGSGKTSLLRSICDALTVLTHSMAISTDTYQALLSSEVVRLQVETFDGRFRFEPQYPVKVRASGEAFGTRCTWAVSRIAEVNGPEVEGDFPTKIWESLQHGNTPSDQERRAQLSLPVLAFYRANRHWNQASPGEMQAATLRNARTDGYARWWDASLDASALQGWVIGKCLERFQTSSERSVPFDDIRDDELAIVSNALALAVEDVKGLRYDLKQKSLLVDWHSGPDIQRPPTAFENLSDGQRAVIGLVADIARRTCLLNPQLGADVTSKTPGVILIDELDIHLHPRWQRIVTTGLKAAFPAVQFIVASHSPQVLGELHPEEIILLRPGGTAHPQVSYGLDSSAVLEEIMGANSRSPGVEESLSELFSSLERNELEVARRRLAELKEMAPGIAELAGASALLKRKEVLGPMKHVVKETAPADFEAWSSNANPEWVPSYEALQKPQKPVLHEALLAEQGWVCCYCGREVSMLDSHIEHFRPQHQSAALALRYENLHASCIRETAPGMPLHCGHAKADGFDEARYISPLDPTCERRFLYTLLGEISPTDRADERAAYMINLLQLDIPFLRNRREQTLRRTFDDDFLASATDRELRILRDAFRRRDPNGRGESFGHVLAGYAEQCLEDRRKPDDPDDA